MVLNYFKIFFLTTSIIFLSCLSAKAEESRPKLITKPVYRDAIHNNLTDKPRDIIDASITGSRQNAITKAVERCNPAIVGINVTEIVKVQYNDPFRDDPMFRYFFGESKPRYQQYEVSGLGSGYIISPDGYILTNHHVAGNASKIIVTMTDGSKHDAEIIGADLVSDVALLKIKGENFPFLKLANSDEVITGEWIIAFGNPFGLFNINTKPTVTVGVVSNSGINFVQEDRIYKGMIQTDAAISSGNSGGPLVNSLGDVIGMNTVIFSTAQSRQGSGSIGIGFAIPINRIKKIVDILMDKKAVDRNFLTGMDVRKIDDRIKRYFKLDNTDGVVITNIYRNTPAERAGFEPGDVIHEIDGVKIITDEDYAMAVNDGIVGQKLEFLILRVDKKLKKSLLLEPRKR